MLNETNNQLYKRCILFTHGADMDGVGPAMIHTNIMNKYMIATHHNVPIVHVIGTSLLSSDAPSIMDMDWDTLIVSCPSDSTKVSKIIYTVLDQIEENIQCLYHKFLLSVTDICVNDAVNDRIVYEFADSFQMYFSPRYHDTNFTYFNIDHHKSNPNFGTVKYEKETKFMDFYTVVCNNWSLSKVINEIIKVHGTPVYEMAKSLRSIIFILDIESKYYFDPVDVEFSATYYFLGVYFLYLIYTYGPSIMDENLKRDLCSLEGLRSMYEKAIIISEADTWSFKSANSGVKAYNMIKKCFDEDFDPLFYTNIFKEIKNFEHVTKLLASDDTDQGTLDLISSIYKNKVAFTNNMDLHNTKVLTIAELFAGTDVEIPKELQNRYVGFTCPSDGSDASLLGNAICDIMTVSDENVSFAFLFYPTSKIISLRSVGENNCLDLIHSIFPSGGGHIHAAGATISTEIATVLMNKYWELNEK